MFEDGRYWDIFAEYSKNTSNDVLIKITIANRGPEEARLHVLPTLWFRNTWSWGCSHEECTSLRSSKSIGCTRRPKMAQTALGQVECLHDTLGKYIFSVETDPNGQAPKLVFTENETNCKVEWR